MFRRHIIAAAIILLFISIVWGEEDSPPYDIYLPQPYEIPDPVKMFSQRYLYMEAGFSSASEFLFFADYIQRNMNIHAFYVMGTSSNRFGELSINGSWGRGQFEFRTDDIVKTAQTDSMLSGIALNNALIFHNQSFALEYCNSIYSLIGEREDIELFHTVELGLQGNAFSVNMQSIIINTSEPLDNIIGLNVEFPEFTAGLSFYRIIYPFLQFQSQHLYIDAGIHRNNLYTELSPFSNAFSREKKTAAYMYIADINAYYNELSANIYINADIDSADAYGDIPSGDMTMRGSLSYTKRFDALFVKSGPLAEYSPYFKGPMYDMTVSYGQSHTQYTAQYRIYYSSGIYNMLNLIFSTGTDHFRFICGVKNVLDEINPYYQYYAPSRTYFLTIALIEGNPIY